MSEVESKYFTRAQKSTAIEVIVPKIEKKRKQPVIVKYEEVVEIKKVKSTWQPENWEKVLANIEKMRKDQEAPVDTMGCHMCHDREAEPKVKRFQMLVALMLSSQTKDQVTFAAMERLRKVGLTTGSIIAMPDEQLGELIKPVGFWRKKIVYLKGAARMLEEEYAGDIPASADALCKLPGVGPKMAHLTMMTAWEKVTGIAVDTHVHRICNRLGWVRTPSSQPTKTMQELESWLPMEHWTTINHLLVGFGQTICLPVNPKCASCLNNDICPAARVERKPKSGKHV